MLTKIINCERVKFSKTILLIFATLLMSCTNNYEVIGVVDGDTIKVRINGKEESVRLAHIDCPEKKQDFGQVAKKQTSNLCFGKKVEIVEIDKDRYGRIIGEVYVDDMYLNLEIIKIGYAWHYKKYSKNFLFSTEEAKARKGKLGLWAGNDPIPPWMWRDTN